MAAAGRSWKKALAVAVLVLGADTLLFAQTSQITPKVQTGSLTGRLTDLHSKPLDGVTVVLRNQATGAELRSTTEKNGSYRFSDLEAGEYMLIAASLQLGRGQVEDIVVDVGHETRVQTAMSFEPLPTVNPVLLATRSANRPDLEPTTLPDSDAALETEPVEEMTLSGHFLPRAIAEVPASAPPALKSAPPLKPETAQNTPVQRPPSTVRPSGETARRELAGSNAPPATKSETERPLAQDVSETAQAQSSSSPATTPTAPTEAAQSTTTTAPPPSKPALAAFPEGDPVSSATTSTMTSEELQALPISGRHWQDFLLDNAPASVTPAAGQGQIALRGAGEQPTEIAVDGMSRSLAFGPTGGTTGSGQGSSGNGPVGQNGAGASGIAQVGAGGHGLSLSEAAIREVQTAAGNVQAAANRAAGGRLNIETQRGSDQLHGQGFLYDRQNTWGARNPFTQWVHETAPATLTTTPVFTPTPYTPPDHETTWGIGLGSRIRREKLFWFAALDSLQRNDPGVATVKHADQFFAQPTNDQMQVLSARLGLSSANPVAEGLAAYSKLLETLNGLLGPSPRTATQWTGFVRLDWEAAERHHFTVEGIGARWNSPGGGLTRLSAANGNHSFGSTKASEEWLLGRWEAFITPNLLATSQASYGDAIQQARPTTPSAFEQGFLAGNAWGQLPQIVVDSRYGFTIGNPSRFGSGSYPNERLYHAQESLDWIRGKLLVKAGFSLDHSSDATSLLRNQTGTYYYSNLENFASDALSFGAFGISGQLDPYNQHNCDQTGKASWRDASGTLRGLGYLPCYTYYSQVMGPTDWRLSTNDWAGYATAQWEANKFMVFSAGLRWEREQLPPPMVNLNNPELPLTTKMPSLGNNWGPRVSMAIGSEAKHWPMLRLGYGMYFARTVNQALETALTQTGSLKGDLNFFVRPTDNLNAGGAPPFPYVLAGEPASVVRPGAVEFASDFHNPEVHQGVVAVEEKLPAHINVTASMMVSLGRRLPISIDTNLTPLTATQTITYAVIDATGKGPIQSPRITVPFYASWPTSTGFTGRLNPDYQQITQIMSRANSTYQAAMLKIDRYSLHGLSLHGHYTYAHAMDWNPNESSQVAGSDVLDPTDFGLEYGVSNLDIRHSGGLTAIYEAPWKLRGVAGKFGNHWKVSAVGQARGGMPYTMRTSGSLPKEFAGGTAIVGIAPGMNGSGGDNRIYGTGSDNRLYNIGRNTFRYPLTWKADLRLGRRFDLGNKRQLELLVESFNLFNHQNVTELETTGYSIQPGSPSSLPTLNFLTGLKANTTAFGQPLNVNATNFYRERQIQLGLRMRF